jgi:hypothetical protein
MTRANIYIITSQGKFKFQSNSSAYPSNIMDSIIHFALSVVSGREETPVYDQPDSRELSKFIDELGLTIGLVGNFSYVYEIDFTQCTIKVWENSLRWVTAPADWKERGWNCWIGGKNKTYGYTNWVKGKNIYNKTFDSLIDGHDGQQVKLKHNVLHEAQACAN